VELFPKTGETKMAEKAKPDSQEAAATAANFVAQMQEAGFGRAFGMSTAWLEACGDMGTEMMTFLAERIKEDFKTQHELMNCKNIKQMQEVQARFVEKAIEQYQAETGKLVEIGTNALNPQSKS
jgi:hypothetical protein